MGRLTFLALLSFLTLPGAAGFAEPVKEKPSASKAAVEKMVSDILHGFRLAEPNEFHENFKEDERRSFIEADFDRDGEMDYAVFAVQPQVNEVRAYFFIQTEGSYRVEQLFKRDWQWNGKASSGTITCAMAFKPAGEPGVGDYKHVTIPGSESLDSESLQYEVKLTVLKQETSSLPALIIYSGDYGPDDPRFSAEQWYYQNGKLQHFSATQ